MSDRRLSKIGLVFGAVTLIFASVALIVSISRDPESAATTTGPPTTSVSERKKLEETLQLRAEACALQKKETAVVAALKANETEDDHPAARKIVLERELASIRQGLARFAPDVSASACTPTETGAP